MAEEEDEALEDILEEEDGEESTRPPRRKGESKKPCDLHCNPRIEELATPGKRIFLALWNEHAYHFPKEKVKKLKLLLQQLYAMSPEETAKYFAELRAEAKAAAMRRKLKQKLRNYLKDRYNQKQRERAYNLFRTLLNFGLSNAAVNPVPPVVSIRHRCLSDIILEQLCDLRKLGIPSRTNASKLGQFMISVADWMAIFVETLYYDTRRRINAMLEDPLKQPPSQPPVESVQVAPGSYKDMGQPLAESLTVGPNSMKQHRKGSAIGNVQTRKRQSTTITSPATYRDMGRPMAQSSMVNGKTLGSIDAEFTTQNETQLAVTKEPQVPFYSILDSEDINFTSMNNEPFYDLLRPEHNNGTTTTETVSGMEQSAFSKKEKSNDTGYVSGNISTSYNQSALGESTDPTRKNRKKLL